MSKTITAIATPKGTGGVAIIRISGDEAFAVADRVFRGKVTAQDAQPYFMNYGSFADGDRVLDQGLMVVMRAPRSFTGEDVVELHCHGGAHVTKRILEATIKAGASLALPGEFTRRAFLNGKIDLLRAEAIGDIIHSETDYSLYQAVNQLDGGLSGAINEIRAALVDTAAQIAVAADYPEEDISFEVAEQINARLCDAKQKLDSLLMTADSGRMIREGVLCALAGRPNTGKSSLLNALLGEKRAIVTEQEGTTRDVIEESIVHKGIRIRLADTAGIRSGESKAEQMGIEMSRDYAKRADVCLVVLEGGEKTDEDREVLRLTADKKRIIVLNKSDINPTQPIEGEVCVPISALTGDGIDALRDEIVKIAGDTECEADRVRIVNVRQKEAAIRAGESISCAINTIDSGFPPDLCLGDVEDAIGALGEMVGLTVSDEITDKVFAQFCLGK